MPWGDRLREFGHDLAAHRVYRGTLPAGLRGQPAVPGARRSGEEQLGDHATAGKCLADRLRALSQERPGPQAQCSLAELPSGLHPG